MTESRLESLPCVLQDSLGTLFPSFSKPCRAFFRALGDGRRAGRSWSSMLSTYATSVNSDRVRVDVLSNGNSCLNVLRYMKYREMINSDVRHWTFLDFWGTKLHLSVEAMKDTYLDPCKVFLPIIKYKIKCVERLALNVHLCPGHAFLLIPQSLIDRLAAPSFSCRHGPGVSLGAAHAILCLCNTFSLMVVACKSDLSARSTGFQSLSCRVLSRVCFQVYIGPAMLRLHSCAFQIFSNNSVTYLKASLWPFISWYRILMWFKFKMMWKHASVWVWWSEWCRQAGCWSLSHYTFGACCCTERASVGESCWCAMHRT